MQWGASLAVEASTLAANRSKGNAGATAELFNPRTRFMLSRSRGYVQCPEKLFGTTLRSPGSSNSRRAVHRPFVPPSRMPLTARAGRNLFRRRAPGFGQAPESRIACLGAGENSAGDVLAGRMLLAPGRKTLQGAIKRYFHIGHCRSIETFRDKAVLRRHGRPPWPPQTSARRGAANKTFFRSMGSRARQTRRSWLACLAGRSLCSVADR